MQYKFVSPRDDMEIHMANAGKVFIRDEENDEGAFLEDEDGKEERAAMDDAIAGLCDEIATRLSAEGVTHVDAFVSWNTYPASGSVMGKMPGKENSPYSLWLTLDPWSLGAVSLGWGLRVCPQSLCV